MRKVNAAEAAELLKAQDSILILTHRNPDGDTLGSGFALLHGLLALGKTVRLQCEDEIHKKYNYMRPKTELPAFEPKYVVAVDIADEKLLGPTLFAEYSGEIDLCIDHHMSNTLYADALYLRECAATCELVYEVLCALGVEITKQMASCLYTGLSTDTGCFCYSNVTPETHEIAAQMLRCGADFDNINRIMFETKTWTYLKLEELVLNSLETGSNESECDGIASLPRKIEGVLVGVTLRERKDGSYKVSLRTYAPMDASYLCSKMGGGGHARAAGCDLEGKDLADGKQKLLEIIRTELEKI